MTPKYFPIFSLQSYSKRVSAQFCPKNRRFIRGFCTKLYLFLSSIWFSFLVYVDKQMPYYCHRFISRKFRLQGKSMRRNTITQFNLSVHMKLTIRGLLCVDGDKVNLLYFRNICKLIIYVGVNTLLAMQTFNQL